MNTKKIVGRCMAGIAIMVVSIMFFERSGLAADEESVIIYPETQKVIDYTVEQCNVEESYFTNIVSAYLEYGYTDLNELNAALVAAANSIEETHEKTEERFKVVFDEYLETVQKNNRTRSNIDINTYNSVLTNYSAGIVLVRAAGCLHTAEAMEHAVVPYGQVGTSWRPSDLRYDNDEWAEYLFTSTGLWDIIEGEFQNKMWPDLPSIITVGPGEYSFEIENSCLDAKAQFHDIDYSVTFVKNPNDPYSYSASFYINDYYNFEWSNYENFALSFGNNYAYGAQQLGVIQPYMIYCTYHIAG